MTTQISAKIIADTINPYTKARITSLQLVYPKTFVAQFNTHRAFSRSTASSRAIPVHKMIEIAKNDPVYPIKWGKNQSGMQASEELSPEAIIHVKKAWDNARLAAIESAERMLELNSHKEFTNRILEPYIWAHTIVTSTSWDNFFHLRLHESAQSEMQVLAQCMYDAIKNSTPKEGFIHLPYILDSELADIHLEKAPMNVFDHFSDISAARCARVSYLNHDKTTPSLEQDMTLAKKLRDMQHCSPFEHAAFSFASEYDGMNNQYSNLKGWNSKRLLLENTVFPKTPKYI